MSMYTDPNRIKPTDKGKVEGNPVFIYHDAFNSNKEEVDDLKKRYIEGKVGDVEVKEKLTEALDKFLDPIRQRREELSKESGLVERILTEGTMKARTEAQNTLKEVKKAMGLT